MAVSVVACNTQNSFTADERALIGESPEAGTMRVLKTDDLSDSLQLRRVSEPLTAGDLKSETYAVLKTRMLATVNDPANRGVGIAAPQVGILKQVIAVQRFDKAGEPFEFYVNPRIERYSAEAEFGPEGCLSIPDRSETVPRPTSITLSFLDESTGNYTDEIVEGFTAVIFQHEVDHLSGILYIDRAQEPAKETTGSAQ